MAGDPQRVLAAPVCGTLGSWRRAPVPTSRTSPAPRSRANTSPRGCAGSWRCGRWRCSRARRDSRDRGTCGRLTCRSRTAVARSAPRVRDAAGAAHDDLRRVRVAVAPGALWLPGSTSPSRSTTSLVRCRTPGSRASCVRTAYSPPGRVPARLARRRGTSRRAGRARCGAPRPVAGRLHATSWW